MKIKAHVIAKVILTVTLALTFSMMLLMMKQIPESDIQKQHLVTLNRPTTTFFDKVDKWSELNSDKFYYVIKPMSDNSIIIWSTLFCIVMVLIMDLVAGVGRSRTEERAELKKKINSGL